MNALFSCVWRELWRKPGRTVLTVLSLAAGAAMLTALSVISRGGTAAAEKELHSLGIGGFAVKATDEAALDDDAFLRLSSLPQVSAVAPLTVYTSTAVLGHCSETVLLCGINENAGDVIAIDLCSGRLPSRQDVTNQALCCTMEETAAEKAFGSLSPTGRTVTVALGGGEIPFTVVGTAHAKSSLLKNLTGTLPPLLLVPYSTLWALTGEEHFDRIALRSDEDSDVLSETIAAALSEKGTFATDSLAAQKERLFHLLSLLSAVLTLAGGAAVAVAGIGVLLTQLSAVTEHVREIGVKKALGAKRNRILFEYLLQAATVSLLGALGGILLGGGAAILGLSLAGIPAAPSVGRAALLFFGTALFGTICGTYPAAVAARLSPLNAFSRG